MNTNFRRMLLLSAFAVPAATFIAAQAADTTDSLETITVVGTRAGADRAQFNAPTTISVMSAEDLEHTAVHNVAEALQLLPGLNVTNTGNSFFGGVDGASRGEGMFAQVRGMNSEFTLNLVNGVDVAQGMPYSREVQLSLLPPSGLQTIIVNKTGGANQQLDFVGGMIDYRTPTAFDFAKDTFSATIGGRAETRAMDYNTDGMGYSAAVEGSKKFGTANQFGFYGSAYFDIRHYANSLYGAATEAGSDSAWAFAVADSTGANPTGYNPAKNLVSTGFNVGVSSGYTSRYGGNAAFDWNFSDATHFFAKVTYAYAHTRQDSTLSQVLGMNVTKAGYAIGTTGLYQPVIGNISTRLWYETNPENANLGTAQVGGETKVGKLSLTGKVYYSWGNNDRPNHIEISNRPLINSGNGFAYGSTSLGTYDSDGFITPLLTSEMYTRLNDNGSNPARRAGQLTIQHSGQERLGLISDATYDIGEGVLKSIQFGVKYSTSWRHVDDADWTDAKFTDGRLFSSLGIYSSSWESIYPGKYEWSTPKIDQKKLFALFEEYNTGVSDSCASSTIGSLCNTQNGRESVAATYAQANLLYGDFEVTPGVRFEHTDIHNVFWADTYNSSGTWTGGAFTSSNTTYDEVLPSLFVNYRPSESATYRASVWTSYTRPAFIQLAAHTTTKVGDSATSVSQGNPDLNPIEAVNFDLSGQWYSGHGGYIQASAFAKLLSDYIYNSGTNYVNSTGSQTNVTKPLNGGDGHVYGIELEFRQKLEEMTGWLNGFSLGGNYTHNWSEVDLGSNTKMHNEPIQNSPDNIANLQLIYENSGFQFDVIWHYTGSYVSVYDYLGKGLSWDHLWVQPTQRVDLHSGYDISDNLRADVSVSNLMGDLSYQAQIGKYSPALTDIVDTGRTILFTIKYKS
jgi:TonB-dependent receptor